MVGSTRQNEKWKLLASTLAVLAAGFIILCLIAPVKFPRLAASAHAMLASTVKGRERVHYDNPRTGRVSNYELMVDRDTHGVVQRITFPNGGWKEIDGVTSPNGDGTETYTDDHGAHYTVNVAAGIDRMTAVYGAHPVATEVLKPAAPAAAPAKVATTE